MEMNLTLPVREIISSSKTKDVILVDEDMYDYLSQWKWYTSGGYAQRTDRSGGKEKTIHMHRVVMGEPDLSVDHRDRNKFDFYGVHFNKKSRKWMARINNKHIGKREYLGEFINEIDACKSYNRRALELYGSNYKRLNRIGSEVLVWN